MGSDRPRGRYRQYIPVYRRVYCYTDILYYWLVKIGCCAGIKLRRSDDCQSPPLTEVLEEPNHALNKVRLMSAHHYACMSTVGTQSVHFCQCRIFLACLIREDLMKMRKWKSVSCWIWKWTKSSYKWLSRKSCYAEDISNIQVQLHEKSDRNDIDALLRKFKSVKGKPISGGLTHMRKLCWAQPCQWLLGEVMCSSRTAKQHVCV